LSNRIELLRKVKALADRGVGGEKETAQATLERLLSKHGLTKADLEEDQKEWCFFSYSQDVERDLLGQIIYMVTGSAPCGCVGAHTNRKRKKLSVEATTAERIEIEANFEFFKGALADELEVFMSAFSHKNHLFPPPSKDKTTDEERRESNLSRSLKISAMMDGMDRHTLLKALEAHAED